jgi:hypothetical protein
MYIDAMYRIMTQLFRGCITFIFHLRDAVDRKQAVEPEIRGHVVVWPPACNMYVGWVDCNTKLCAVRLVTGWKKFNVRRCHLLCASLRVALLSDLQDVNTR